MSDPLQMVLADLDEETLLKLIHERLTANQDPQSILTSCRNGMMLVGQRYETGEYFLSELIMAGEIFKQVVAQLPMGISSESGPSRGKIIFGTVKGDIHTIGKDLVVAMLRAAGYEVTDLGIDVPAEKFVEAVIETGARIVGLSGLLTFAYDSMKATVNALQDAGLRPGVKVMIGGASVTETVLKYTGADAFGLSPQDAVNLANGWVSQRDAS